MLTIDWPGGKVEEGEDDEAALVRELKVLQCSALPCDGITIAWQSHRRAQR